MHPESLNLIEGPNLPSLMRSFQILLNGVDFVECFELILNVFEAKWQSLFFKNTLLYESYWSDQKMSYFAAFFAFQAARYLLPSQTPCFLPRTIADETMSYDEQEKKQQTFESASNNVYNFSDRTIGCTRNNNMSTFPRHR